MGCQASRMKRCGRCGYTGNQCGGFGAYGGGYPAYPGGGYATGGYSGYSACQPYPARC